MNKNIEEKVTLPQTLAAQLGNMTVRYLGWEENDREEESSKLLCEVVWNQSCYSCPLLLPLQGIVFDEQLTEDCRDLLCQMVDHESELEWRDSFLDKIESAVQKAAVLLYKQLLKIKILPDALRPKTKRRKTRKSDHSSD